MIYNYHMTIAKTAEIHTRIQPSVKRQAERIFAESGHTASDAIEQFYIWTIKHGKTPMRLRKHANIPDEALMSDAEADQMINEARADYKNGNYISLDSLQKEIERDYGLSVQNPHHNKS